MEDVDVLEVVFLFVESVQTFDTFEDGFAQLVQSLDVLWVGLFADFLHEFWVREGGTVEFLDCVVGLYGDDWHEVHLQACPFYHCAS